MRHILADETIQEIADLVMELQTRENTVMPALKKQLKDTERGIENMLNAIQQGIITSSTKQRLDELEAAKENLVISIAQEEMQKPLMTREQVVYWISRFKNGNPRDEGFRQRLIDAFINSIYLYDDRIIINSNYKDGTRTITLEEVEKAFGDWDLTGSDLTLCAPPRRRGRHIVRGSSPTATRCAGLAVGFLCRVSFLSTQPAPEQSSLCSGVFSMLRRLRLRRLALLGII